MSVSGYPRASVGATRPYEVSVGTGSKEPTTVSVDFGDGSPPAQREITGSATPSYDHAYQQAGEFHIVFTVTDSPGESVTGDEHVLVEDPVAAAGPDVTVDEGGPRRSAGRAPSRTPTRP